MGALDGRVAVISGSGNGLGRAHALLFAREGAKEVIHVHLKGHFVPTHWAANYWREQTKEGKEVKASIINTSSTSGLLGNPGQTNYGAAKAGIASFSIICAQELARYGVRSNAIAP